MIEMMADGDYRINVRGHYIYVTESIGEREAYKHKSILSSLMSAIVG